MLSDVWGRPYRIRPAFGHGGGLRPPLAPIQLGASLLLEGLVQTADLTSVGTGANWYVSPTGTGSGTLANPWGLQTALNHPASVHPGDTIWLRGGLYTAPSSGNVPGWIVNLRGTASKPIIVRSYPGEWARLDCGRDDVGTGIGNGTPGIALRGSYYWLWDFELFSSACSLGRINSTDDSWAFDCVYRNGFLCDQSGTTDVKIINVFVHDTKAGFSLFSELNNLEAYGCFSYYNGWQGASSGHAHGWYIQNTAPSYKTFRECVTFNNFSMGGQWYGSAQANIDNMTLIGMIFFSPYMWSGHSGWNVILGGGKVMNNPVVKFLYDWPHSQGGSVMFGYDFLGEMGTLNGILQDSVFGSPTIAMAFDHLQNATIGGVGHENLFVADPQAWGPPPLFNQADYPNNIYLHGVAPATNRIYVRPNAYQPKRANVVIFNYQGLSSVNVDFSSFLSLGDRYVVQHARDYFGPAVASGVYSGAPVSIPMTGLNIVAPIGYATPAAVHPAFAAFVVQTPQANQWYVAPNGSSGGTGKSDSPWTLQYALDGAGGAIHPGDTVWMRGGTYAGIGQYNYTANGTAGNLITYRSYPGEWARLDGGTNQTVALLNVIGTYAMFRDFELTSSSTSRVNNVPGSYGETVIRPYSAILTDQGAVGNADGCKFVNLILHNCIQGYSRWQTARNTEIYGCVIYYNGYDGPDRGHGHGLYMQNETGSGNIVRDCISIANYDNAFQIYGSSASRLNDCTLIGNGFLYPGLVSPSYPSAGNTCVVGSDGTVVTGLDYEFNFMYHPGNSGVNLGYYDYGIGVQSPKINSNYAYGQTFYLYNLTGTPIVNANVSAINAGGLYLPSNIASLYPGSPANVWGTTKPTSGSWTEVRPNQYEAGRGHVYIANWSHANSVSVDVSAVLSVGDNYAIYHCLDPVGAPVVTGTYAGGSISFPMTNLPIETPAGVAKPSIGSPTECTAFILKKV